MTYELLDAQGQIPEMENLFEEATVKAVIKKANPQSAAGRLDNTTDICRLRCAMNWSRFSRRLRRLVFADVFCPKCAGHCTRVLTFPRWGKGRDQWRAVMFCGELLALFLPPIWQEAGRLFPTLGPVRRSSFRRSRDNGAYSNTGFRRGFHHSLIRRSKRL